MALRLLLACAATGLLESSAFSPLQPSLKQIQVFKIGTGPSGRNTRITSSPTDVPERARTLRAVIHAEDKNHTTVHPGRGRFLLTEQPDLLTISVHLPFVNNEEEQEVV